MTMQRLCHTCTSGSNRALLLFSCSARRRRRLARARLPDAGARGIRERMHRRITATGSRTCTSARAPSIASPRRSATTTSSKHRRTRRYSGLPGEGGGIFRDSDEARQNGEALSRAGSRGATALRAETKSDARISGRAAAGPSTTPHGDLPTANTLDRRAGSRYRPRSHRSKGRWRCRAAAVLRTARCPRAASRPDFLEQLHACGSPLIDDRDRAAAAGAHVQAIALAHRAPPPSAALPCAAAARARPARPPARACDTARHRIRPKHRPSLLSGVNAMSRGRLPTRTDFNDFQRRVSMTETELSDSFVTSTQRPSGVMRHAFGLAAHRHARDHLPLSTSTTDSERRHPRWRRTAACRRGSVRTARDPSRPAAP